MWIHLASLGDFFQPSRYVWLCDSESETRRTAVSIIMGLAHLVAIGATAAVAAVIARSVLKKWAKDQHRRVLVAVSGTIQDGFELRKNINFTARGEQTIEAVLVGNAVMRGVKMFFDIKDTGCREYDANTPHRVNPAMVLTGNRQDANQYAIYLVDERACLNALLGEPRLLTMVPDALRIDLDDKDTSPNVAALARAFIAADGKSNTKQCAVLSVVPCYQSANFVPAPPVEVRPDGTKLTSFRDSLAAFAGIKGGTAPGSDEWNSAVAKALAVQREAIANGKGNAPAPNGASRDDSLYGTDPNTCRLSRRLSAEDFNAMCVTAGVSLCCQ